MATSDGRICRTCMKRRDSFVNLFDVMDDFKYAASRNTLADLLKICTPVKAIKEDGLPETICQCCSDMLIATYKFRNQCEKSDEILRTKSSIIFKQDDNPVHTSVDVVMNVSMQVDEGLQPNRSSANVSAPPRNGLQYFCNDCGKEFKHPKKMEKHIQLHTSNKDYICKLCNKRFFTVAMLTKHKNNHNSYEYTDCFSNFKDKLYDEKHNVACSTTNENVQKVEIPSDNETADESDPSQDAIDNLKEIVEPLERSLSVPDINRNDSRHRREKLYECIYCSRKFRQLHSLNVHTRVHTGEVPYLCSECGKGFTTDSNLKQHMLRHTGLRPFACNICPKTFNSKGTLTAHIKTHSDVHPHICDECGNSFTHPGTLKKHRQTHLGLKPWACNTCDKRFSTKEHLKRHILIHTGEKPYKCEYCDKAFNQTYNLVVHTRSHIGENLHRCDTCDETFRLLSDLKKHYLNHSSITASQ